MLQPTNQAFSYRPLIQTAFTTWIVKGADSISSAAAANESPAQNHFASGGALPPSLAISIFLDNWMSPISPLTRTTSTLLNAFDQIGTHLNDLAEQVADGVTDDSVSGISNALNALTQLPALAIQAKADLLVMNTINELAFEPLFQRRH
jgi:hypothetical protein